MGEPIPLFQPHLTLDRREAEVVREAVKFSLWCKPRQAAAGELRALEIRLHNYLTSTKET